MMMDPAMADAIAEHILNKQIPNIQRDYNRSAFDNLSSKDQYIKAMDDYLDYKEAEGHTLDNNKCIQEYLINLQTERNLASGTIRSAMSKISKYFTVCI